MKKLSNFTQFQLSRRHEPLCLRWLIAALQHAAQLMRPIVLVFATLLFAATASAQVTSLTVTVDPPNPTVGQPVFVEVTQTGPDCRLYYRVQEQGEDKFFFFIQLQYAYGGPAPCTVRIPIKALPAGSYTLHIENLTALPPVPPVTLSFAVSAVGQTVAAPTIGFVGLLLLVLGVASLGIKRTRPTTLTILAACIIGGGGGYC